MKFLFGFLLGTYMVIKETLIILTLISIITFVGMQVVPAILLLLAFT